MHTAARIRRRPLARTLTLLTAAVIAVGLLALPASPAAAKRPPRADFVVTVLSSAPEQVSDGDALLQIDVPRKVAPHRVRVFAGRTDVTDAFERERGSSQLTGLVSGLPLGKTDITVRAIRAGWLWDLLDRFLDIQVLGAREGLDPAHQPPPRRPDLLRAAAAAVRLHDCAQHLRRARRSASRSSTTRTTSASRSPPRTPTASYPPTAAATRPPSARSSAGARTARPTTRIDYLYKNTAGQFRWLDDPPMLPADIATTTTLDGKTVPYVVRWERGTINRFIYSVAMLAPATEADPNQPDDSLWNGRLVFSLQGGVAIGHHQGTTSGGAMLFEPVLGQGYAVVNSTGLRTNTHYNLQLGGETALMLKEHFIEDHGVPLYTVGVGGSGGAIQQYVYAQNHPGLLDAAIPQYSYPDMVTQTIHVGDCELLEHYFDVTDRANPTGGRTPRPAKRSSGSTPPPPRRT